MPGGRVTDHFFEGIFYITGIYSLPNYVPVFYNFFISFKPHVYALINLFYLKRVLPDGSTGKPE